MTRYFLKTVFMYARPIPVETKVHFRILRYLAVTYDIGGHKLSFRCCLNDSVFFLCLSNF